MNQKLTVIVPIYNGEQYLNRCVDSIVNQSYRNIEIILVDNGSNDSTGSICDSYAEHDSRVKVIHRKECGNASIGRNAGINMATGEWITFVDADDWLEPDFYQEMFRRMPKDNDAVDIMISGGYYRNNKEGYDEKMTYQNAVFDYKENTQIIRIINSMFNGMTVGIVPSVTVWDRFYRTDFLNKNGILFETDIFWGEDFFLNLITLEKAGRVAGTDYIGYHYYWNNMESITHKYDPNLDIGLKTLLIKIKQNLQKENLYDCLEKSTNNRTILYILSIIKIKYFNRKNNSSYFIRKKEFNKLMREDIFHNAIYGEKNKMVIKYRLSVFFLKIHYYIPFELYYRYIK